MLNVEKDKHPALLGRMRRKMVLHSPCRFLPPQWMSESHRLHANCEDDSTIWNVQLSMNSRLACGAITWNANRLLFKILNDYCLTALRCSLAALKSRHAHHTIQYTVARKHKASCCCATQSLVSSNNTRPNPNQIVFHDPRSRTVSHLASAKLGSVKDSHDSVEREVCEK